jgi:hypothetical protein
VLHSALADLSLDHNLLPFNRLLIGDGTSAEGSSTPHILSLCKPSRGYNSNWNPGLQEMKALSITRTANILEGQRCLSSSLLIASLEATPAIWSWI